MSSNYNVMLEAYNAWPINAMSSFAKAISVTLPASYSSVDHILVCGMGGSGVIGDYLRVLSDKYGWVPVKVVKDYRIPIWVSTRTLALIISYSGNTIETLKCYNFCRERGAKIIAITSGGRLGELCREHGTPVVYVPKAPAARTAFASMFYASLGLLMELGVLGVSRSEVDKSIEAMRKISINDTIVRKLAELVSSRIPVVTTILDYEPLAIRMKNELNENTKIQAKVEILPEWGHNDIEGWTNPIAGNSHIFIILDPGEEPETSILGIAREVYSKVSRVEVVELYGSTLLQKLAWGTLFAAYVSLEASKIRGIDPLSTGMIKEYRNRINTLIGF